MRRRTIVLAGGLVAAAAAIGTGVAVAGGGDDDERPITGDALRRASAAALAHAGAGRVTATEVGDEESVYEVEVTLEDGRTLDVQLDESFRVVGDEVDGEDESGDDEADR